MPRSSQSQKTLTILRHEARLRKYALLTFGAQGTQDLAVLGAILGNNIHEIGRYRVTCDGATIHGKFSVYELVHFGVLFATGRRSSPRYRSNKKRRQNQQCPASLCSDGGDDVTTAAEGGEGEMEEQSGLCVTAPRIYPAMLANLFPTIVFKTLRKKSVRPQKFQHDDEEDDDLAIGQGSSSSSSSSQLSSIQSNNSLVQATPQKARSVSISGPQMVTSTSLSLQSQLQDPSTQSSHLQDIKDQSNRKSLQEQEKEQQHLCHLDFTSRARADDDNENADADSEDATDVILRRESDCPCTPTPCLQQQQKLQPQQMQSQLQSSSLPQQQQQKHQQYPHQQHQPMQGGDQSDPLLITSDVVLATLARRHIHRVRDLPLPQELSFLGAVSLPLPSSLRAMHVAWTIDFLRTKTTTPRRLRQEQKRYSWSSGEDGGSALMPELYGGLEFRPEVYAYKMGLARVARFQDRQQQQQQQQQRFDQEESPSKRRGLPADVIPEESEEDLERLEQEKEEEKDEEKEEPMRSDQAISASRISTTITPDIATSPIPHSATGTTPSRLHPSLDSVNRDKRLVQQLLSLENKVPRAVRQWAEAARRCFAEDLLHEDSLVQEWVDRRRIQVVLHCTGSNSVGSSSMFLAGLSSHLNNGCTISTQGGGGGGGAGCTDNSYNNNNNKSNSTGDGARRRRPPSLTLVSPHWVEQAQRRHSRLRGGAPPPPLRTPTTSAIITTTASTTACAGGNVVSSSQQVTDQDKGVTGALVGSATTTGPTCFAEGERVRTSRPISQQLYSQHHGGSPQQIHGCARRSRPSSALGYGVAWAQSPGLNHHTSNNKGTHRISTSQQMLSMHLWLSLLVSPMSPERMVKDQFGFMDSLN